MNWDTKRKIIYALTFVTLVSAALVTFFYDTIFPAPTCFDGKKNGYEVETDCGGTCSLRCSVEVNPFTVVWSKAVLVDKGLYDLVAMVSNTNIDNASREVGFNFALHDETGVVFRTVSGSTTVPLDGKFPLIIQNIALPKAPENVVTTLTDGPHYKVKENPASPTIKILSRRYEKGSISRVYATLKNTKQLEINNLEVRVLLFDVDDNVYAVGTTFVPVLPKEGVRDIVITWNGALATSPTRIGVYPIFNPFDAIDY
jgi:hypothetical protein